MGHASSPSLALCFWIRGGYEAPDVTGSVPFSLLPPQRTAHNRVRPAATTARHRLARMSIGLAIAVGAVTGLALGIVIGLTTDVPLAPEVGLVVGALGGWLSRRDRA